MEQRRRPRQPALGYQFIDSKMRSICVSMPPELFIQVRDKAVADNRSFSNTVSILLRRGLRDRNDNQH